jgi:hypothetical protein
MPGGAVKGGLGFVAGVVRGRGRARRAVAGALPLGKAHGSVPLQDEHHSFKGRWSTALDDVADAEEQIVDKPEGGHAVQRVQLV